jgi:hypothetical protein
MPTKSTVLAALIAFAAGPALAQGTDIFSVRGTVEKLDATSISVKNDADGTLATFALAPNWRALENKTATLADIRPDDFVASAAVLGPDNKLHSTELRIFPDALRGVGEGQRPMNDERKQTMTNATVTGTAIVNGSNDIKVKYKGGESELVLDPGVPVTRIDVVDKSLVKTGAKVRLQGVRTADGASVSRVTIQ